ncbi:hypothetical protein Tsubulata_022498 [Turnera subulata]|uniref:Protein kinase domain-containing protein n=1 Tax=Turnera subulata TaxID=218843 RepID=A0A9Q0FTS1_9ROSI|nr:hypothetical protein Tsubulata_022498 [Turnera subulata]
MLRSTYWFSPSNPLPVASQGSTLEIRFRLQAKDFICGGHLQLHSTDMEEQNPWARRTSEYTNGFSQENLIGNFQFGKVYRGVCKEYERGVCYCRKVTVKVWEEENNLYTVLAGDNEIRLQEEAELLQFFQRREKREKIPYHRNLAKLKHTYLDSTDGLFMMVYDLDPIDTVQNLLDKDVFTWQMRIKVALGVASLLKFLHAEHPDVPFLIRNLAASHIMLDQAQEPILFDFSMISGGNLYDKRNILNEHVNGCHGYVDPTSACPGAWSDKCDVFSYGVLLLQLVSKVVDLEEVGNINKQTIFDWAWREFKSQKSRSSKLNFSLIHPSLESDPLFNCDDGIKFTKLALQCVHNDPRKRPSMEQVHSHLLKLNVARSNVAIQGEGSKLGGVASNLELDERSGRRSLQEDNNLKIFSYDELRMFTNDFNNENKIADFQFGNIFRGTIQDRQVVVKIWQSGGPFYVTDCDNAFRLRDEIILLQHPQLICHPNMVKLIGYCRENEDVGVVYDLRALDTIFNLILKDRLTWVQTIKISIGFASLLDLLHTDNPPLPPFIVRNISTSHIMVDQDFFPKLIDYGRLAGGILPCGRLEKTMLGIRGVDYTNYYSRTDYRRKRSLDVHDYGEVLLSLLRKKVMLTNDPDYQYWAKEEYKAKLLSSGSDCSLVHESFTKEVGYDCRDAIDITKLAIQCVEENSYNRPTMDEVVRRLLKLHVVSTHIDQLHINKLLLRDDVAKLQN